MRGNTINLGHTIGGETTGNVLNGISLNNSIYTPPQIDGVSMKFGGGGAKNKRNMKMNMTTINGNDFSATQQTRAGSVNMDPRFTMSMQDQPTGKVFDYTQKNINKLKELKNQNYVKSKNTITNIYERMQVRKTTNGEMNKLTNLNGFLSSGIKQRFMNIPMHSEMVSEM